MLGKAEEEGRCIYALICGSESVHGKGEGYSGWECEMTASDEL